MKYEGHESEAVLHARAPSGRRQWAAFAWAWKYAHIPVDLRPRHPCRHCGAWPWYESGMIHHTCEIVDSHLWIEDWEAFNHVDGYDVVQDWDDWMESQNTGRPQCG
jgi:hypothetical protein